MQVPSIIPLPMPSPAERWGSVFARPAQKSGSQTGATKGQAGYNRETLLVVCIVSACNNHHRSSRGSRRFHTIGSWIATNLCSLQDSGFKV